MIICDSQSSSAAEASPVERCTVLDPLEKAKQLGVMEKLSSAAAAGETVKFEDLLENSSNSDSTEIEALLKSLVNLRVVAQDEQETYRLVKGNNEPAFHEDVSKGKREEKDKSDDGPAPFVYEQGSPYTPSNVQSSIYSSGVAYPMYAFYPGPAGAQPHMYQFVSAFQGDQHSHRIAHSYPSNGQEGIVCNQYPLGGVVFAPQSPSGGAVHPDTVDSSPQSCWGFAPQLPLPAATQWIDSYQGDNSLVAGQFGTPPPPPPRQSFHGRSRPKPSEPSDTGAGSESKPKPGKSPCAFFLKTGTCAYGDKCKFDHPAGRQPPKLNSCGYPIRPDEEDCVYFMRRGVCGFGMTCKFNHPEIHSHAWRPGAPVPIPMMPGAPIMPYAGMMPSMVPVPGYPVQAPLGDAAVYQPAVVPSSDPSWSQPVPINQQAVHGAMPASSGGNIMTTEAASTATAYLHDILGISPIPANPVDSASGGALVSSSAAGGNHRDSCTGDYRDARPSDEGATVSGSWHGQQRIVKVCNDVPGSEYGTQRLHSPKEVCGKPGAVTEQLHCNMNGAVPEHSLTEGGSGESEHVLTASRFLAVPSSVTAT